MAKRPVDSMHVLAGRPIHDHLDDPRLLQPDIEIACGKETRPSRKSLKRLFLP